MKNKIFIFDLDNTICKTVGSNYSKSKPKKKIIKLKNNYEKPSEKKKRILQDNIKRVKKLNKLKNII